MYNDHASLITQRIASAFSKFNELKHVLTDRRIRLKTRVKFLTACVRSRLTFSVQACLLKAAEITKLESVWTNLLRKLVRNGFQRVNVPPSQPEEQEDLEEPNQMRSPLMTMKTTLTGDLYTAMKIFSK